jgi:hypothetical protein
MSEVVSQHSAGINPYNTEQPPTINYILTLYCSYEVCKIIVLKRSITANVMHLNY